jgi:hypothetical protein
MMAAVVADNDELAGGRRSAAATQIYEDFSDSKLLSGRKDKADRQPDSADGRVSPSLLSRGVHVI